VDATTFIEEFAKALGAEPPSEGEKSTLLSLASVAANASERLAAPICCWVVAQAGRTPEEGLALARQLSAPAGQEA
jgi:hypothetical protein